MSDDDPILDERRGNNDGILWVTLNRPEKMNALTFPLLRRMREIFDEAHLDRTVRCVVITGAGRGVCAGMDMGGGANPDASPKTDNHPDPEGHRLSFRVEVEAYLSLRKLEVPVIVGINGPAVGAGFDLVCHCDLAVGSTAARYQVAYVKRGLYPDLGGFWSLPRLIGWRKSMDLMMTGRFMSAEEAHESGLTNFLVKPEAFEETLMKYALEIEAGPPIGQKVGKMLAYRTASMPFDQAMAWSETAIPLVDMSQDFVEGRAAFLEKRDAEFKGK